MKAMTEDQVTEFLTFLDDEIERLQRMMTASQGRGGYSGSEEKREWRTYKEIRNKFSEIQESNL